MTARRANLIIPNIMTRNNSRDRANKTYRLAIAISLLVITPLGFASKLYRGPWHLWFNNYAGGLLYEIFWILLIALFWPKASPLGVSLGVFLVTCFLECLQLWHPPFLEAIRATFLGQALLGTTFVWWDFPYYIIGCTLGWLWLLYLQRHFIRKRKRSG